jgi:DNA replication protein DnaC
VWVTAAKLARWERYDEEAMNKLLRTPRLVIDDLGGEYLDKGGFYASLLDELINERQSSSRPTIMTTNLAAEAFKARYGERIVDRIREGGRFFECGNASLRRKQTT